MTTAETNKAERALNNLKKKYQELFKGPQPEGTSPHQLVIASDVNTYVRLKTPPMELPINRQNCCAKNTQVISLSFELV